MINQNQDAISSSVVYFGVKNNKEINTKLKGYVDSFFKARNIQNHKAIPNNAEISDLDFKKLPIDHFYDFILNEISKSEENVVEFSVRYSITLDKGNCSQQCRQTGFFYDEILLHKKPIFYFIYQDIEEIFTFLRTSQSDESKKN